MSSCSLVQRHGTEKSRSPRQRLELDEFRCYQGPNGSNLEPHEKARFVEQGHPAATKVLTKERWNPSNTASHYLSGIAHGTACMSKLCAAFDFCQRYHRRERKQIKSRMSLEALQRRAYPAKRKT